MCKKRPPGAEASGGEIFFKILHPFPKNRDYRARARGSPLIQGVLVFGYTAKDTKCQ